MIPRVVVLFVCLLASINSSRIASGQDDAKNQTIRNDSLFNRLIEIRHIGLFVDERLGGFTLHIHTPEQQKQKVASLAAYRIEHEEWKAKMTPLSAKYREAIRGGASAQEVEAIGRAQRDLREPRRPVSSLITLYDIVAVGTDYVEIRASESPESTMLIPFHKICSVVLAKSGQQTDAPKENQDGE